MLNKMESAVMAQGFIQPATPQPRASCYARLEGMTTTIIGLTERVGALIQAAEPVMSPGAFQELEKRISSINAEFTRPTDPAPLNEDSRMLRIIGNHDIAIEAIAHVVHDIARALQL